MRPGRPEAQDLQVELEQLARLVQPDLPEVKVRPVQLEPQALRVLQEVRARPVQQALPDRLDQLAEQEQQEPLARPDLPVQLEVVEQLEPLEQRVLTGMTLDSPMFIRQPHPRLILAVARFASIMQHWQARPPHTSLKPTPTLLH